MPAPIHAPSSWQVRATDLVDVFVYTVVLALFAQFLPQFVSESFALSMLTAVQLGGFFQVTLLIVVLMLARGGVRRLLVHEDESRHTAAI